MEDDKLHEECGVFGVWGVADAAAMTALGLHALQHRGQEATGIVAYDGARFHSHRGLGLVGDNFSDAKVIASLPGHNAVGHNRYATTGDTILRNVQPLYADFEFGGFAVAHNGNLTNAHQLHKQLVRRGCLFQSTTDSEVFVHLIAISLYSTVVDRLIDALKQVVGAYSLVALSNESLMGVRDPKGVRPLILGRIGNHGDRRLGAGERDLRARHRRRRVHPGPRPRRDRRHQRPGRAQHQAVRRDQGPVLRIRIHLFRPAGLSRWKACRSTTPASGSAPSWPGKAMSRPTSSCRCRIAACRPRWATRRRAACRSSSASSATTMSAAPSSSRPTHIRNLGVKLKHSANQAVLEGKRVILVDDSIVRGTTSRKIVEMVRAAGAAEVHMRISSPPTTHSCFYGIDTPERGKLLAARHSVDEMAELIGADSLAFVSLDGLYRALGQHGPRRRQAALLRRLLHRRIPDRAAGHDGQHGTPAQPADRDLMDKPVALVTGASRGIGAALALSWRAAACIW